MVYTVFTAVLLSLPIVFILSSVAFEILTIEQSEERRRERECRALGKTASKQVMNSGRDVREKSGQTRAGVL